MPEQGDEELRMGWIEEMYSVPSGHDETQNHGGRNGLTFRTNRFCCLHSSSLPALSLRPSCNPVTTFPSKDIVGDRVIAEGRRANPLRQNGALENIFGDVVN